MRNDTYFLVQRDRDPDLSGRRNIFEAEGTFTDLLRQAESDSRMSNRRSWIYAAKSRAQSETLILRGLEPPPEPAAETEFERHKRVLTGVRPTTGAASSAPRTASEIWREVAGIPEDWDR